ncbi:MAG: methyltransferase [Comamonadaceae bacterium BICA1-1]|nr:MAG: methyltransferase [Comamonadaceae bacterium BICA1-1]
MPRLGRAAAAASVTPRPPPGTVRLIGGLYKRSKLQVPDRPGLRPTPDRVRETLFNWLGQDLRGLRCLDAFAGTGALGLEAASRGAATVYLLERDPALVQALRASVQRLGAAQVQVQQADALAWMRSATPSAWDVVFLDPPFAETAEDGKGSPGGAGGTGAAPAPSGGVFMRALAATRPLLAPGGLIYLEAPLPWSKAMLQPLGLQVRRQGRAGQVHYHLLVAATL